MKNPKMPFDRKRIRLCCLIIKENVGRKAWSEAPVGEAKGWILSELNKRRVERFK